MTEQELRECMAEVKYSDMHNKAKKTVINLIYEKILEVKEKNKK